MLFSEPKIPQRLHRSRDLFPQPRFQCSSASRKFLNAAQLTDKAIASRFSALQRAENSSTSVTSQHARPVRVSVLFSEPKIPQDDGADCAILQQRFQCSSASRKFLKSTTSSSRRRRACFSALQRAENSSRQAADAQRGAFGVSVLFSEPKIPQRSRFEQWLRQLGFSALQRAENSSKQTATRADGSTAVSVLFSEPKIPQFGFVDAAVLVDFGFQCSSASRKFLNVQPSRPAPGALRFQCSSASRKFLNC